MNYAVYPSLLNPSFSFGVCMTSLSLPISKLYIVYNKLKIFEPWITLILPSFFNLLKYPWISTKKLLFSRYVFIMFCVFFLITRCSIFDVSSECWYVTKMKPRSIRMIALDCLLFYFAPCIFCVAQGDIIYTLQWSLYCKIAWNIQIVSLYDGSKI